MKQNLELDLDTLNTDIKAFLIKCLRFTPHPDKYKYVGKYYLEIQKAFEPYETMYQKTVNTSQVVFFKFTLNGPDVKPILKEYLIHNEEKANSIRKILNLEKNCETFSLECSEFVFDAITQYIERENEKDKAQELFNASRNKSITELFELLGWAMKLNLIPMGNDPSKWDIVYEAIVNSIGFTYTFIWLKLGEEVLNLNKKVLNLDKEEKEEFLKKLIKTLFSKFVKKEVLEVSDEIQSEIIQKLSAKYSGIKIFFKRFIADDSLAKENENKKNYYMRSSLVKKRA